MRARARQGRSRHRLSASASTAWATSGSGAARSAATAGARPATSPTPGRSMSRHRLQPGRPREVRRARATGTTRTCSSSARSAGARTLHPTRLTPNEQITHITLWCLLAAPLLIGCDMSQMDAFTIDLLTQRRGARHRTRTRSAKPAGRRAQRRSSRRSGRAPSSTARWPSACSTAVAKATTVTARWSDLGLEGHQPVRDLWQHKDLGAFSDAFTIDVPRHGAILLKIGQPQPQP